MTTLTDTAAILYVAILGQPEDDTLRLAFADALEDAGDHDRAEFIRVQVELASLGSPVPNTARVCELAHREHELLAAHGDGWRRGPVCDVCGGKGSVKVDGPYEYSPIIGGYSTYKENCMTCHGTGYTSPLSARRIEHVGYEARPGNETDTWNITHRFQEGGWQYDPQFSRGLIAQYSATHSEVFDATGPSEWACDVARAFPIQEIRLTTHPAWEAGGSWGIGGNPHQNSPPLLHFIHWEVRQLAIRDGVVKANDDLRFPTRELAEHYQARACAEIVRAKAFEEK